MDSVCIPSSIDCIRSELFNSGSACRVAVVAFEYGSQLRHINPLSFCGTAVRSLCIPASVRSFDAGLVYFPTSLEIVTFEPSPDSVDGRAPFQAAERSPDLLGKPTYILGRGNRHFAVVGQVMMNFKRSSVILYGRKSDRDVTIDSTVQELGPCSFCGVRMKTVTFSRPWRLRTIGESAFGKCESLAMIVIPGSVEVIGGWAFAGCWALQEVRFGRASQLQRIKTGAFDHCPWLQPMDVPSRAKIGGDFTLLAHVSGEDGSNRVRVQFVTKSIMAS
jgi:hypothetical protein